MRVTLHIGTAKTGTTSIQHFLHENSALLAEQGCLYPQSLLHPVLSRENRLCDHNQLAMHLAFELPGAFRAALQQELAGARCPHLLISAEMLSLYMDSTAQIMRLRQFVRQLGGNEICVVVWLRESGALFSSLCSEWLRFGHADYTHRLLPQACPRFRTALDSRAMLTRWAEVFGRKALKVRLFERECFVGGDLLHDAIDAFGLKWDERFAVPERSNESLNLLEMELLRIINHLQSGAAYMSGTPKALLFEVLHRHAGSLDGPQLRFAPPVEIVQAWREWAAEGNEWVRREFFPERQTLFTPPRAQEENYELTQLTPGCWEALGRIMAELSEENFRLRRAGVQPPPHRP